MLTPATKVHYFFAFLHSFCAKLHLFGAIVLHLFYTNGANVSFVLNFMRNNVCVFAEECLILRMEDAK